MTRTLDTITESEFHRRRNDSDGICLSCGEWAYGDCEPDAEEYPCDHCGENKVVGIETAVEGDHIAIAGDE